MMAAETHHDIYQMAEWQSGYAAACKAVYAGSIPTSASNSRFASHRYVHPSACFTVTVLLDFTAVGLPVSPIPVFNDRL